MVCCSLGERQLVIKNRTTWAADLMAHRRHRVDITRANIPGNALSYAHIYDVQITRVDILGDV